MRLGPGKNKQFFMMLQQAKKVQFELDLVVFIWIIGVEFGK